MVASLLVPMACHRGPGPVTVDSLAGTTVALVPSPALRLVLPGGLAERQAEVQLDVAAPISIVNAGCFPDPLIGSGRVTVSEPLGADQTYPLTRVVGLEVGPVRLRPFEAALAPGRSCVVVLGADLLGDLSLHLDVARRQLAFRPSRTKAEYVAGLQSGDDAQLIELTRDPRHDWPLFAVRVQQGESSLTAPFVLSTTDQRSRVLAGPADANGLKPALERLAGVPIPPGLELPKELSALDGVAYEHLEVSPGVGVTNGSLALIPGDAARGVSGALGVDVLGHFNLVIDVRAGVLLLERPRNLASGSRVRCGHGEDLSDERCFELEATRVPTGVLVTSTIWRPLEENGRLTLDLIGTRAPCRVGFTYPPGDRGRSTQHLVPWPHLYEVMPACATALAQATSVTPGSFEEGAATQCPGVCAFAQDLVTGSESCECQPGSAGVDGDAERRFLELYKKLLQRIPAPPADPEPKDPE